MVIRQQQFSRGFQGKINTKAVYELPGHIGVAIKALVETANMSLIKKTGGVRPDSSRVAIEGTIETLLKNMDS